MMKYTFEWNYYLRKCIIVTLTVGLYAYKIYDELKLYPPNTIVIGILCKKIHHLAQLSVH